MEKDDKDPSNYGKRTTERLRTLFISTTTQHNVSPAIYENRAKDTFHKAISDAVAMYAHKVGHEDRGKMADAISETMDVHWNPNRNGSSRGALMSTYSKMHQQWSEAADIRSWESKLDYKERRRYLAFRILTACGFAAVLLLTAYIAQRLGIQLPWFRMI